MKQQIKHCILLLLALAPIVSVAFAAQSALSIAQIGIAGVSDNDLAKNGGESAAS
ncbi:MAG: hypothetical protein HY747_11585 [Elusimicrobia bacterium]|nr:hypothetical protein [Elusimicrobiota bacterium]